MTSLLVLVVVPLGALYVLLSFLLRCTQDSREPPTIEAALPFISPIFGMLEGTTQFFVRLRNQYQLPIYTLRMPGQRTYVVNSLPLIISLQRKINTVAFAPIEAQAADAVMGVGPAGNSIIGSDDMCQDHSYLGTHGAWLHPALSPGPGLDAISSEAVRILSASLAKISKEPGLRTVELFRWARGEMFSAVTGAVYGPHNPFEDPALERAWYDFEPGIMTHMLKAWPSVLARKSHHAREKILIPTFERFFEAKHQLEGSLYLQSRYNHNYHHGLRGRDIAATEIGHMVASLVNTEASAFWMAYHIFSDPVVLGDCRAELEHFVKQDMRDPGLYTLDLANVRSACPILLSTWQETLRREHIGIAARIVMEDTMLDDKYLLRKDATVMMAAPVTHTDEALWGPDVLSFDHRRFVRRPGEKKRTTPAAFRSFGGGAVLCPGRHFVSTLVMSFAAILLLRFDLKAGEDGTEWPQPRKAYPMTSSMPTPMDELPIKLVPRDDRRWRFEFSDSKDGVSMVAEDTVEDPSRKSS